MSPAIRRSLDSGMRSRLLAVMGGGEGRLAAWATVDEEHEDDEDAGHRSPLAWCRLDQRR